MALDADNTSSNDGPKGVAKIFNFDIEVVDGTENKLVVKFLTPVNDTGVMEICDVNLIYVGANLPCLKKELPIATFTKRY